MGRKKVLTKMRILTVVIEQAHYNTLIGVSRSTGKSVSKLIREMLNKTWFKSNK